MPLAHDLSQPAPGIFAWQAYDPTVKSELFSTAFLTASGLYFVDPIPLQESLLQQLVEQHHPVAVIVTNANHARAAVEYSTKFSIPIVTRENSDPKIGADLAIISIDGAVDGEIAVYSEKDGGTLIVGDALINFPSYGFTFLPKKYCNDEKQMRRSLRQLIDLTIGRIFFAHGEPILTAAGDRLRSLLES